MERPLEEQQQNNPDKVKSVLNILIESPYFYRTDADELFMFLRRHRSDFAAFFKTYYGWELIVDDKCARVYKDKWYNEAIAPSQRLQFSLSGRDECIAFMLLIEFFEHQLEENSMTVEDKANLRFVFSDMLEYICRRFAELFEENGKYTAEYVRANILRSLLPKLVKFRFLLEVPKPAGMDLNRDQYIYEALPALYHYNSGRLGKGIFAGDDTVAVNAEPDDMEEDSVNDEDFTETEKHDGVSAVSLIIDELDEDKNAE